MANNHTIELWSGYTVLEREDVSSGEMNLFLFSLDTKNWKF